MGIRGDFPQPFPLDLGITEAKIAEKARLQKPSHRPFRQEKAPATLASMANKAHVAKLKEGVAAWNAWRAQHPDIQPNLSGAYLEAVDLKMTNLSNADLSDANLHKTCLHKADLSGAYLFKTDLAGANLNQADLMGIYLSGAYLEGADLSEVDLRRADLDGADLKKVNFNKADLCQADLYGANLTGVNLSDAQLGGADLREANLCGANLRGALLGEAHLARVNLNKADLTYVRLQGTIFAHVDLTTVRGLESCDHWGPSSIDHHTLERSGNLPLPFLQGCGLSDWEIEATKLYQPGLTHQQITDIVYRIDAIRAESPIQIHNLFISYAHADSPFVEHLEGHLEKRHVRFWRDVHDAPAGPLEKIVVRAMRHNPTVLLILSACSVESDWVEFEARQARKLAKELDRDVLCPIVLDDSWKDCKWPQRLRDQIEEYHILDFSCWQDPSVFEGMFERLLAGLDLFYGEALAE